MLLTRLIVLSFNELVRDLLPVAESTLHYALDEEQFLFCTPVLHGQRKVKVVKYVVSMTTPVGCAFLQSSFSVTVEAEKHILALHTLDLHALVDVSIAHAADRRSYQVVEILKTQEELFIS